MGFKSKNNQSNICNQSNLCNPFKVEGLIFDSEEDYLLFKDIDRNIKQTVKLVNRGRLDIEEFFNNIKMINVKETYFEASEEMDGMFPNVIDLLLDESIRFRNEIKVGRSFFKKINIIEFCDSDSDSDSD